MLVGNGKQNLQERQNDCFCSPSGAANPTPPDAAAFIWAYGETVNDLADQARVVGECWWCGRCNCPNCLPDRYQFVPVFLVAGV